MCDTRGYATRRPAGNLWVPARLTRGRAAVLVAVVSTLALIAVLYVGMPLTGAVAPIAHYAYLTVSGLCLTTAATALAGVGVSSGCAGPGAAGADFPRRAGSAEPRTAARSGPPSSSRAAMAGDRRGNWPDGGVKKRLRPADRSHAGLSAGPVEVTRVCSQVARGQHNARG